MLWLIQSLAEINGAPSHRAIMLPCSPQEPDLTTLLREFLSDVWQEEQRQGKAIPAAILFTIDVNETGNLGSTLLNLPGGQLPRMCGKPRTTQTGQHDSPESTTCSQCIKASLGSSQTPEGSPSTAREGFTTGP